MTKKNEQIATRKPLRRRSWLGRLLRDERGNGELFGVCLCGAIAIGGGIALKDKLLPKVETAVGTVGDNLNTAMGSVTSKPAN